MKYLTAFTLFAFAFFGSSFCCGAQVLTAEQREVCDRLSAQFAYNMANYGPIPEHQYLKAYEQRIADGKDYETKRLYVLAKLYRSVQDDGSNIGKNQIMAGQGIYREMTKDERTKAIAEYKKSVHDLRMLDPTDPYKRIEDDESFVEKLTRESVP